MILVLLGTQDKHFTRLLDEIEKIDLKEKIIVQVGSTKYESSKMEMFDLIPNDETQELMKKASLIITHGGVGSIIEGLKLGKPIIAAARLKKHGEHVNDHQLEIIGEFAKEGFILELKEFSKLEKLIEKSKKFKPQKYKSNTENIVKMIIYYIEG